MIVDQAVSEIVKVAGQVSIENKSELCVKLMAIFGDQLVAVNGVDYTQQLLGILSDKLIQH